MTAYSTTQGCLTKAHRSLIVLQKAKVLAISVYELTEAFPHEETFGLTAQMRRAAVSIPSNIAEGRARGSRKEYVQFLRIALGSGAELETQVEIAKELKSTKHLNYESVDRQLSEVMKMLHGMLRKLAFPVSCPLTPAP